MSKIKGISGFLGRNWSDLVDMRDEIGVYFEGPI
jgi:hypothetical protein